MPECHFWGGARQTTARNRNFAGIFSGFWLPRVVILRLFFWGLSIAKNHGFAGGSSYFLDFAAIERDFAGFLLPGQLHLEE